MMFVSLSTVFHIFYYPWYGNPEYDGEYRQWNHRILPHWSDKTWDDAGSYSGGDDIGANFYPQLGCYSSNDPEIIDRHMQMISSTGTGVVVVSWWGEGSFEDRTIPLLLESAIKYNLRVSFHIEPFYSNAEEFRKCLGYLQKYMGHPAIFKLNGKPLHYVYDSFKLEPEEWERILSIDGDLTVRDSKLDAVFIGLWVEEEDGIKLSASHFDGFYTYFASEGFVYGSSTENWGRMAEFAQKHDMLFVPCIGPGYSDTRIRPWNAENYKSRDNGRYYKDMFRAATVLSPDFIGITSFNEWHEGTQIEPALSLSISDFLYEDYGVGNPSDYYLKITKKLIIKQISKS